jgi:hypothetical protein
MAALPINRKDFRIGEMNDKLLGDIAARLSQWAAGNPARVLAQLPSQRRFTLGSGCR